MIMSSTGRRAYVGLLIFAKRASVIRGDREYYVLDSVYGNRMQTYIPVDNISVIMRPTLKKEEVLDLIQSLPDIDSEWIQDDNQRKVLFSEILQSCDPTRIAHLIKTIYHRQKRAARARQTPDQRRQRGVKNSREVAL